MGDDIGTSIKGEGRYPPANFAILRVEGPVRERKVLKI